MEMEPPNIFDPSPYRFLNASSVVDTFFLLIFILILIFI